MVRKRSPCGPALPDDLNEMGRLAGFVVEPAQRKPNIYRPLGRIGIFGDLKIIRKMEKICARFPPGFRSLKAGKTAPTGQFPYKSGVSAPEKLGRLLGWFRSPGLGSS
jgi:hypothetical protein